MPVKRVRQVGVALFLGFVVAGVGAPFVPVAAGQDRAAPPAVAAPSTEALLAAAFAADMHANPERALALFRSAYLQARREFAAGGAAKARVQARIALTKLTALAEVLSDFSYATPLAEALPDDPHLQARVRAALGRAAEARGDLAAADAQAQALGYLTDWMLIGPFRNESGIGFDTEYPPEDGLKPWGTSTVQGAVRPVAWRPVPVKPRAGVVDLAACFEPKQEVCAYAALIVRTEAPVPIALRFGTQEGYKLWVNGVLVRKNDARRARAFDSEAVGLTLPKGASAVLLKVCAAKRGFSFAMRMTAPDGGPLAGGLVTTVAPKDTEAWHATLQTVRPNYGAGVAVVDVPRGSFDLLEKPIPGLPEVERLFAKALLYRTDRYADEKKRVPAETLEQALKLAPNDARLHYYYALWSRAVETSVMEREESRMRQHLERALALDPKLVRASLALYRYYADRQHNLDRAERYLARAVRTNPEAWEVKLAQAEYYQRRGYRLEADQVYEALVAGQENARYPAALWRAMLLYAQRNGRAGEALQAALHGLSADNASASFRRRAFAGMLRQGQFERAEALAEAYRALAPFTADAYWMKLAVARARRDTPAAVAACEGALAIDPESERWLVELGRARFVAGDDDAAHEAWKRALTLNPQNTRLKEYFEFIAKERVFYEQRFFSDAAPLIAAARAATFRTDLPTETVLQHEIIRVLADGRSRTYGHVIRRVTNKDGINALNSIYLGSGGFGSGISTKVLAATIHRADGSTEEAKISRWGSVDSADLKVGEMVEYRYRQVTTEQTVFGDYYGNRVSFGARVPIRRRILTYVLPNARTFRMHPAALVAKATKTVDAEEGVTVYRWQMDDLQPVEPEPGMPPLFEVVPTLEVSSYEDWNEFAIWYYNLIKRQLAPTAAIKEKVAAITKGKTELLDKVRAVYEWVANKVRYNDAWEFGIHGYKPYTADTILKREFGDCKDKAILINTMLETLGVTAYPVIINGTMRRGAEDISCPRIGHFNHCISLVELPDGRQVFADGTASYTSFDVVPAMDLGARVLIVRPDGGKIVTIPWAKPEDVALKVSFTGTLSASGTLAGKSRATYVGPRAAGARQRFSNAEKRQEQIEQTWGGRYAGAKASDLEFPDVDDLSQADFSYEYALTLPGFARRDGTTLVFEPVTFRNNLTRSGGLAALDTRKYDLLLGPPRGDWYHAELTLPKGFTLAGEHPAITRDTEVAHFSFTVTEQDGRLTLDTSLRFKTPRITVRQYPAWRKLAIEIDRLESSTFRIAPKR